jgi:multisubunit Na+/H+ antiporter MnhC subunit
MFQAMVYKVGQVSLGVGWKCCYRSFKKNGIVDAMQFCRRIYISALVLTWVQVGVATIEAIVDSIWMSNVTGLDGNTGDISATSLVEHYQKFSLPCSGVTAILALIAIYNLQLNDRLMKKVTEK